MWFVILLNNSTMYLNWAASSKLIKATLQSKECMVMETPGLHGPDPIPFFSKPAWGSRDRGSQLWCQDTILFNYWSYSLENNQPWRWTSAAGWNAPLIWVLDTHTSIWSGLRSTPTNEKHHYCNGSASTRNLPNPCVYGSRYWDTPLEKEAEWTQA